jgi:hypothetical protein
MKAMVGLSVSKEFVSFAGFFSEPIFSQIKRDIDLPPDQYRVVSLGIPPSVAQYNGMYTLDSYQTNYSRKYKQEFYTAIAPELERDSVIKKYFHINGRCYVYSKDLWLNRKASMPFLQTKGVAKDIVFLHLNAHILYAMGCRYILSAVKIGNGAELGLKLLHQYEDEKADFRIFLYSIAAK